MKKNNRRRYPWIIHSGKDIAGRGHLGHYRLWEADAVELSDAEKALIDERLEAYHADPSLGSPWEDVFKRITAKKNAK